MTFIPSTDAFWVLYLINVLQPVGLESLRNETHALWKSLGRTEDPSQSILVSIDELTRAQLVVVGPQGLHATTLLGIERLSLFKLGRIRDKNRLFLLKKGFKAG